MKLVYKIFKIILLVFGVLILLISILFGHKDIEIEELKSDYGKTPSEFVSFNEMEVHYRDEGDNSDSIPIVLIHGTGASLHTFDAWTKQLQKNYRVVRMDLPGFGLTGPFPDGNYAMENYVGYISQFLEVLDIDQCILGGNSLGGEIAWRFTAQYPEKVEKLILIDAAGYPLESKSVPLGFRMARTPVLNKIMTYVTPRSMVRSSVENVYTDKSKVSDELVERYFKLTLREGNRQALVDRMTMKNQPDKTDLIKTIRQPTLILWGEDDLLIPVSYAYRFEQDLPDAALVLLKDLGHVPMEEDPEASLPPVLEFLTVAY